MHLQDPRRFAQFLEAIRQFDRIWARLHSIQSAVQHFSAAIGAFFSAKMLQELPSHRLEGISKIASVSIGAALLFPVLAWTIESRLRAQALAAPEAPVEERAA